jgi:hypothetical protein
LSIHIPVDVLRKEKKKRATAEICVGDVWQFFRARLGQFFRACSGGRVTITARRVGSNLPQENS